MCDKGAEQSEGKENNTKQETEQPEPQSCHQSDLDSEKENKANEESENTPSSNSAIKLFVLLSRYCYNGQFALSTNF